MILTKKVIIKITNKIITHYKNLGYDAKRYEYLEVDTEHLTRKSNVIVKVKCDICGNEKELPYQKYTKNIDNQNYYACSSKCSVEKYKKTNFDKYGVTHPLKSETVKEKYKQTCNNKYGTDYFFQTEEFKEKSKITCNEKYDCDYAMQSNEIKEKFKISLLEKYGVENVSYLDVIQEKIKNTKIKNNIIQPDHLMDDFHLYKRKVKNYTLQNKKELFENWNGYDYYDGEYIKNNFDLNCLDRKYPTIDHKISLTYGFNNGIDPKIIGNIDNLCITKKYINSEKGISNNFIKL